MNKPFRLSMAEKEKISRFEAIYTIIKSIDTLVFFKRNGFIQEEVFHQRIIIKNARN